MVGSSNLTFAAFRKRRFGWLTTSFLAAATMSIAAQQQPDATTIRVETNLIEVPVTVTDRQGHAVMNLSQKDFRIYEDGVEQRLHHFTSDPGPVSWGLILDRSGSMASMMKEVYTAAVHMLDASSPQSEAFIMTFDNKLEMVQEFTADRARLQASIDGLLPGGGTALWKAVSAGLEEMKKAKYRRRALVVVTDGDDNESMIRSKDLMEEVRKSDVLVYSVAMTELDLLSRALSTLWSRLCTPTGSILYQLAEASGAYAHWPRGVKQCKKAMGRIASEVNHQYILGYYPQNSSGPPRFRKLAVQLQQSKRPNHLVVRARHGYFGPRGQVDTVILK